MNLPVDLLCAHLSHTANGWPATHQVRLADGRTVGICDMCLMQCGRPGHGRWFTVNSRRGVVWADLGTAQPMSHA